MSYTDNFNIWWERAPTQLHKPSKKMVYKSYQKVLREWIKDNPDKNEADFVDKLIHSLAAEEKYRKHKREANEFHPEWPHGTTYLNQWRFEAEFVDIPTSELKERKETYCECGEVAVIHNLCAYHYSMSLPSSEILREAYKKLIERHGKNPDWKALFKQYSREFNS